MLNREIILLIIINSDEIFLTMLSHIPYSVMAIRAEGTFIVTKSNQSPSDSLPYSLGRDSCCEAFYLDDIPYEEIGNG